MLNSDDIITQVNELPAPIQSLIFRELARLETVEKGELAGSEYEMVLALESDTLDPQSFLAEQNEVFRDVIEQFNRQLAMHPDVSPEDKAAWHMDLIQKGMTASDLIDIISYYTDLTNNERRVALQGIETLLLLLHQHYGDADCLAIVEAMRQPDYSVDALKQDVTAILPVLRAAYGHDPEHVLTITVTPDERIHPDVTGTFEGVTPPFALHDRRADLYAEILHQAICAVPKIRPTGSIYRGMHKRLGLISNDSVQEGLPYNRIIAFARFGVIGLESTGNFLIESMKDAGQHCTVGVIPNRLNDTYRVQHALLPLLAVLEQNSSLPEYDGFALRTIRGAWIGQKNDKVRSSMAFTNPEWSTGDVIAWHMLRILNAPCLGKMTLDRTSGTVAFQPAEEDFFQKTVTEVLMELYQESVASGKPLTDEEMEKLWNKQTKIWGPIRLRGLIENGDHHEILIEMRVADTATPIEGLQYQRFIQILSQDEKVLNATQDYFEQLGLMPRKGQPCDEAMRTKMAMNLHETALQAMTGRDGTLKPVPHSFDTLYHGIEKRVTLGDTVEALASILQENGYEANANWLRQKRQTLEQTILQQAGWRTHYSALA